MTDQLFHQINTWLHYIGGYYKSTQQFINEARKFDISRRVPANVVRGMNFGDRVILLRHNHGAVCAFAEMVINGVVVDSNIAEDIGNELVREGRATCNPGGGIVVNRACGSFTIAGGFKVNDDVELPEIMDKAQAAAEKKQKDLWVMINGKLTIVYHTPEALNPPPPFTRGFIRADNLATFTLGRTESEGQVIAIENYTKNELPKAAATRRRRASGKGQLAFGAM